ncbi:RAD18 [Lepeophtheirus salmonis]|uniref:RAD18 n=1 Tax=Lepeophtheirus salmonis TaxID=72036 RepID=A0A7R8CUU3_LEPSM|nr:RAD18 [Lepeophtheirus salmonis]CAF2888122.1 RAD18 [Lepeophtheirus salmonis]
MKESEVEDSSTRVRKIYSNLQEAYPRLESVLSCSVCYETISDPVLTKCSHSFCSLCIRRYMIYKLQCPACFQELHERDLIPNKPLRDVLLLLSQNKSRDPSPSQDCNICGVTILTAKLEAHSLQCSNSPSKTNKTLISSMKPISKPVIEKTLVSRHQRFVILWNSECSKEKPLSQTEIVSLVEKEEMNELKRKKCEIPSVLSQFDRNSDPKLIEMKQKEILSSNKHSFQGLINNIKAQRENKPSNDSSISENDEITSPISSSKQSTSSIMASPSTPKISELYVTPKRKVFTQLVDSNKKMKQNSVQSLFQQTEKRKVNCPSCDGLITASFLNIHLDRCLEVESGVKGMRNRPNSNEDEDFVPIFSQSSTQVKRKKKKALTPAKLQI